MPYIDSNARPKLDALTDPIIDHIRSLPLEEQDGVLDYVVTRMLMSLYHPPFFNLNRALGVLSAIALEFYRVVVVPYEEKKIQQFGAVKAKEESHKPRIA